MLVNKSLQWLCATLTLAVVLTASVQEARADIVFINLNGSATEMPAAESVARQNGERMYVIPSKPVANSDDYATEEVTQDLIALAKLGVRPRTLIISGHHAKNEGFWGTNGELSVYAIAKMLPREGQAFYQESQDFFNSLQSVYLWGCYTGLLGNAYHLLDGSNSAFKNTKFVVGFGEKGPLNTDALSGRMLKDVLQKESQFRSGTLQDTYQLLRTVPAYQQKDLLIHRGNSFVSQGGASTQEVFLNSCREDQRKEALGSAIKSIWDFYWNLKGPIPEDTSKGALRLAYKELQRNNYCIKMGAVDYSKEFSEIPALPNTLRLIFYKNVMQNFARIYAPYLQFAQKELTANGISGVEFIGQLDQIERGVLMAKLEVLHKQIKVKFADKTVSEKQALRVYLNGMIDDIEEVVYPNEDYVPLRWIDPNAKDWAPFPVLGNFEKAKAAAFAQPAK